MTVKEFFEQFPTETAVLKVGDSLFFQSFPDSAREFAETKGIRVEVVPKGAAQPEAEKVKK